MNTATTRLYAVQGIGRKPADRVAHMLASMAKNKAYVHARDAVGDPSGKLLRDHIERFRWYRQGWRGIPARMIENKIFGEAFRAENLPPLCLDMETASICDLACPFCYRQWVATPDKIMDKDLAFRLIDQAAELGVPSMKFNWRGEPLLNPRLPEIIAYAKMRGILDTMINTNATQLDDQTARALIEAGLDHIIYSFDGGSETSYDKMRPGRFAANSFARVYANIVNFARVRSEMGSPFPFTKIQMILTEETFSEQEEFFRLFGDVVDDVSVKAYTERGGKLKDVDSETRAAIDAAIAGKSLGDETAYWRDAEDTLMVATGRLPCEQIYQRLMVAYDGRVSMCCYDWGNEHPIGYVDALAIENGDREFEAVHRKAQRGDSGFELLGNVAMPRRFTSPEKRVQTLSKIWHGDLVNDVRRLHVAGRLEDVAVCTGCPFKDTYQWTKVGP